MSADRRPSLLHHWVWLKQVASDRDLTPSALHVALALADKVNPDKGYALPRLLVLEEVTGLKERGIRGIVDQLVARGHLTVKVSRGPGASNRYWLQLKDAAGGVTGEPDDEGENRHDGAGVADLLTLEYRHDDAGIRSKESGENRHDGAGKYRHGHDRNTGTAVPPTKPNNKPILIGAASPLGGSGRGRLSDDVELDPDDPAVMSIVEAVCDDALAAPPPPDAHNRGNALKRIRRRLRHDRDFSAFRHLIETVAYRVSDLRQGVREAIERRRVEPVRWLDFTSFVQRTATSRLEATPRSRPNA